MYSFPHVLIPLSFFLFLLLFLYLSRDSGAEAWSILPVAIPGVLGAAPPVAAADPAVAQLRLSMGSGNSRGAAIAPLARAVATTTATW